MIPHEFNSLPKYSYKKVTVFITEGKHNAFWFKMSAHTFSSTNNDEAYTNSGRAGTYNCLGWHLAWKPWFFHSSDSKLGQMSGVVWKWFLDLKQNGLPAFPLTRPTLLFCADPAIFMASRKEIKRFSYLPTPIFFWKLDPDKTDKTVPSLLIAWAWTHPDTPKVSHERKKVHGPTKTPTQDSHTVQAHLPPSYLATWSTFDKSMVTELSDQPYWPLLLKLRGSVRSPIRLPPHQG